MSSTQTNPDRTRVRKRSLLTLKTKFYIINQFESGEKIKEIANNLNLPNSTVSTIIRDKKRILSACRNTSVLNSNTIIRKRHGIIAQMEGTLKTWWDQQTEQNIRLTQSDISAQAKIIFEALKRDYGKSAKNETFSASKGWYFRFRRRCERNRISEMEDQETEHLDEDEQPVIVKNERKNANISQTDNTDVRVDTSFSDYLKTVIEEGGYTPQTVFNVDEVGVYWKRMPEGNHLAYQNQYSDTFNEAKDRFTILLGGNAAGDLKLKPVLIYRKENPRPLLNKSKGGLPVIWKSNPKASMTSCLFEDWFAHHFIPEMERYCFANNIPCKVLLVIDNEVYHPVTTLVNFDHRVNLVFLPPGESSIQPQQEISRLFKAIYTRYIFSHLVESSKQNNAVTVEEIWKDFNILDAIRIIVDSWDDISETDWNKSWRKLCPFFDISGSETSITIAEIVEEIVKLASELDMKIDQKGVCELLDSHNKELTIEELIEMQDFCANEEIDTPDPLQSEGGMTMEALSEAIGHIKRALQILEHVDVNEQRARTTKLGVMKLLSPYEEILNEKIKLTASNDQSVDIFSNS